jgi:putative ABC transport system permease protein
MIRDLLQEAYSAMRHNRRRTALTMLGMAWGIATVVLLMAYGAGFQNAIHGIFETWGVKVIGVFGGRTSLQAGGMKSGTRIRFVAEDIDRITNSVPAVRHITPMFWQSVKLQNGERTLDSNAQGATTAVQSIRNLEIDEGRFFNEQENAQHARVAVIGPDARSLLFSGLPAVGESIRINGMSFQVVGILQPKPQEGDNSVNKIVYIPLGTMSDLRNTYYIDSIWFDYQGGDYERVEQAVRAVLANAHGFRPDDRNAIFVFNGMKRLSQFDVISTALKVLLGFIGAITLGIGGVGLMNIMLVAVNQRTREIGVEKALGARRRHILFQFLSEALVITAVGGVVGIALSYAVSYGIGSLPLYSVIAKHGEAGDIRLLIDLKTLLVATGILGFVGLISGMLPAIRAANLDPIEALRYE